MLSGVARVLGIRREHAVAVPIFPVHHDGLAILDRSTADERSNPLVPLYARDPISFTPSFKGVPIRLVRSDTSGAATNQ